MKQSPQGSVGQIAALPRQKHQRASQEPHFLCGNYLSKLLATFVTQDICNVGENVGTDKVMGRTGQRNKLKHCVQHLYVYMMQPSIG